MRVDVKRPAVKRSAQEVVPSTRLELRALELLMKLLNCLEGLFSLPKPI